LSELGGMLLGAGHAPAETKRISKMLHSPGCSITGVTEPESGAAPRQLRFLAYVWL